MKFKAQLSGDAEVPPVASDAKGKADFKSNKEMTEIDFKLKAEIGWDILGMAGAHIHCSPGGQNGPVVVHLAGAVPGGFEGKLEIKATLTEANILNIACGPFTPP